MASCKLAGNDQAPIGRTLSFDLIEVERGRVAFEGSPSRSVYNPIGSVHGGYAATLLDSACGCAVHSKLEAGQGYTTLELKVAFQRALTDQSGPVRCEGVEGKVTQRLSL
ncbi:PaaI family thioesterase [uncultured Brevundimonas sp.]|uniref:PaaI family thioesterase n=1 Tax=uncultured Brevundimonas sp. TaxID=213418 RepID=UPI0025FE1196|nr:PaaI family thioesterase [uncultured Brevundimonas sp.]